MVERIVCRSRTVTAAAITAVFLGSSNAGCVEVNGGAAELSWSLRTPAGDQIESCTDVGISRVRLEWMAVNPDAGLMPELDLVADGSAAFECAANRGVTDFSIQTGRNLFWIVPLCRNGAPPAAGTYEVPPPILRTVQQGSVVTLNSLLVVAAYGSTCVADSGTSAGSDAHGLDREGGM